MADEIRNRLLCALSAENRERLLSKSKLIPLPVRSDLSRAEETPEYAYFINSGIASRIVSMKDGTTAEVGVVGVEGLVGATYLLGPGTVLTNSFIQMEGSAFRIRFGDLQEAFRSSQEIRGRILEYVQEKTASTSQIAACNRLHGAEERLARWLLMCRDRVQSDDLRFTQEFLAMMLGAQRTTVTLVAGELQRAGLIEYSRGRVKILDAANLERTACDCYPLLHQIHQDLYSKPLNGATRPRDGVEPQLPAATSNRLLAVLSRESRAILLANSKSVSLPVRTDLYYAHETPQYGYFLTSGLASMVTSTEDGAAAEVGAVGAEGLVGAMHLLGPGRVLTNSFVQLEGSAIRVPFEDLHGAFFSSGEIRDRILEYVQQQTASTSQIAACNRLHTAEERLARWLLMCRDRVHSDELLFTQEFLATMLGAQRTTVTLIAGTLQRAGLIEYSRGRVKILDAQSLEAAACDCYPPLRKVQAELYSKPLG